MRRVSEPQTGQVALGVVIASGRSGTRRRRRNDRDGSPREPRRVRLGATEGSVKAGRGGFTRPRDTYYTFTDHRKCGRTQKGYHFGRPVESTLPQCILVGPNALHLMLRAFGSARLRHACVTSGALPTERVVPSRGVTDNPSASRRFFLSPILTSTQTVTQSRSSVPDDPISIRLQVVPT